MILIDTHCHLYLEDFASDIDEVIQRAEQEGVRAFYLPAIDSQTSASMLDLEDSYRGKCFAMSGLHPCSVKNNYKEELQFAQQKFSERSIVAVGEIGLDFYWDRTFEQQQYEAFHTQMEWALHFDIPAVIHSRAAMKETIAVIKEHQRGSLKGIFHCFSGNETDARQIIEAGFLLGIGGVLTYRNSGLAEALKDISLENMVLETDSPYLTPVPFRGKRNESAYLKYIVQKLAEVKGVEAEEVARTTTENAAKIFGR